MIRKRVIKLKINYHDVFLHTQGSFSDENGIYYKNRRLSALVFPWTKNAKIVRKKIAIKKEKKNKILDVLFFFVLHGKRCKCKFDICFVIFSTRSGTI